MNLKKIFLLSLISICFLPALAFADFSVQTVSPPRINRISDIVNDKGVFLLSGIFFPDNHKIKPYISFGILENANCEELSKDNNTHTISEDIQLIGTMAQERFFDISPLVSIGTTYKYCAWGKNDSGHKHWGQVYSFTATLPPPTPMEPPFGYKQCAYEGQTCNVTGPYDIAFGFDNKFVYKKSDSGVEPFSCVNANFDYDPNPGANKACFYRPKSPGDGYYFCASEGQQCYPGTKSSIAFGIGSQKIIKTGLTNAIDCTVSAFGSDPVSGKNKACFFKPEGPDGYVFAGGEGDTIPIDDGQRNKVAYGTNNTFLYKYINGTFTCNKKTFTNTQVVPNGKGTGNFCFIDNSDGQYVPFVSSGYHNVHTSNMVHKITNESAELSGSATLTKTPVSGYFRYSSVDPGNVAPVFCNQVFGDDMKATDEASLGSVPTGTGDESTRQKWSTPISGLEPNTKYYYCAIASDKQTIEYGLVSHFTTANDPGVTLSSLETKPATNIKNTSATLNAVLNTSIDATVWFEYQKQASFADLKKGAVEKLQATLKGIPLMSSNLASFNPINTFSSLTNSGISGISSNSNSLSGLSSNYLSPNSANVFSIASDVKKVPPLTPVTAGWTRVGLQKYTADTAENISFALTNLEKNSIYKYRVGMQTNALAGETPDVEYGDTMTFKTISPSEVGPGDVPNDNNPPAPTEPLSLGQTATAPDLAIVRSKEGVEHVFVRQIMANTELAKAFGYQDGTDLNAFAWNTADMFARTFGYVGTNKKEIRVSYPDRAAYELRYENGKLTVYEYFDSKIVAIQNMTSVLKGKYYYEYYFNK